MNIIKEITARISDTLKDTKTPCKGYKTEAAAERATEKVAIMTANHFARPNAKRVVPARYVVFYHEEFGKWIGAIDLTEVISRPDSTGGYLGIVSRENFFSF